MCSNKLYYYHNISANGRTALLWAAYFGHADSLRSLMKSPSTNPDIADPDGRTGGCVTVYVCVHVCVCACVSTCLCEYVYVCLCICVCVSARVCKCAHLCSTFIFLILSMVLYIIILLIYTITVLHWATKPESIECIRVIGRFCGNIGTFMYKYMFGEVNATWLDMICVI